MGLIDYSRQPAFKQGYKAHRENKQKTDNPWLNALTKNAQINQIYWDKGWEKGASEIR